MSTADFSRLTQPATLKHRAQSQAPTPGNIPEKRPPSLSPLAHPSRVTRHPPRVSPHVPAGIGTPAPPSLHPNGGQRRSTAVNGT